jgi:hypothetical protein
MNRFSIWLLRHREGAGGWVRQEGSGEGQKAVLTEVSEHHSAPDDNRYPGEELGKVQINNEQYFGNVPLKAWELTIGGYQPAQKWLKDRRDRTLSMEEIQHYQKIIVALMETGGLWRRLMGFLR